MPQYDYGDPVRDRLRAQMRVQNQMALLQPQPADVMPAIPAQPQNQGSIGLGTLITGGTGAHFAGSLAARALTAAALARAIPHPVAQGIGTAASILAGAGGFMLGHHLGEGMGFNQMIDAHPRPALTAATVPIAMMLMRGGKVPIANHVMSTSQLGSPLKLQKPLASMPNMVPQNPVVAQAVHAAQPIAPEIGMTAGPRVMPTRRMGPPLRSQKTLTSMPDMVPQNQIVMRTSQSALRQRAPLERLNITKAEAKGLLPITVKKRAVVNVSPEKPEMIAIFSREPAPMRMKEIQAAIRSHGPEKAASTFNPPLTPEEGEYLSIAATKVPKKELPAAASTRKQLNPNEVEAIADRVVASAEQKRLARQAKEVGPPTDKAVKQSLVEEKPPAQTETMNVPQSDVDVHREAVQKEYGHPQVEVGSLRVGPKKQLINNGIRVGPFVVHKVRDKYQITHVKSGKSGYFAAERKGDAVMMANLLGSRGKWDFRHTADIDPDAALHLMSLNGALKHRGWRGVREYMAGDAKQELGHAMEVLNRGASSQKIKAAMNKPIAASEVPVIRSAADAFSKEQDKSTFHQLAAHMESNLAEAKTARGKMSAFKQAAKGEDPHIVEALREHLKQVAPDVHAKLTKVPRKLKGESNAVGEVKEQGSGVTEHQNGDRGRQATEAGRRDSTLSSGPNKETEAKGEAHQAKGKTTRNILDHKRFEEEFGKVFDEQFKKGGSLASVKLSDLRSRLPHYSREEFDEGLRHLRLQDKFALEPHEGRSGSLSEADRESSILESGQRYYYSRRKTGSSVPKRDIDSHIIEAMHAAAPRVANGDVAPMKEVKAHLREKGYTDKQIDDAMLGMFGKRKIVLSKVSAHLVPKSERQHHVADDEGNLYNVASLWNTEQR